jgi:peptidoglycan L-alanyl-D-glutamate endopeptidase CwlK
MFVLSNASRAKLVGVHPDLVKIVNAAIEITTVDFCVTEGLRTLERQKRLLEKGATTTLHSRHLTGHAVDLAAMIDGEVRWDWPLYGRLAIAMKTAARDLALPLEWGGDWTSPKDGPHFQLPWQSYPAP